MTDLKQSSVALLEDAIDRKIRNSQKGRDTTLATVTRVDTDGTTWVRVYGGAEETPVRRMTSSAHVGDVISVVFSGLSCMGVGNVTNPSASVVQVEKVEIAARGAAVAAKEAWAHADDAATAAQDAWSHADDASTAAQTAWSHADTAQESADRANFALSDVENVLGTLNWIAEHGEYVLTSDQTVVENKAYYTRSGSGTAQDPYVYTVVLDPQESALSTYYELSIDESVQNYIASHLWMDNYGLNLSVDSANGYRIHQGTVDGSKPAGTYVISPSGYVVASFGASGFQVGITDESHMVGDYHSFKIVDKEGDVFFHVSDLRDSDGNFTETFECDGTTTQYKLKVVPKTIVSVKVDGSDVSYTPPGTASATITLDTAPADGSVLEVVYEPYDNAELKALTYGSRAVGSDIGCLSYAEGQEVIARGRVSHAEGYKNEAASLGAHAEGQNTKAYSPASHSEGVATIAGSTDYTYYGPHAEGLHTSAQGDGSHAEGYYSEALLNGCHAEGGHTTAVGYYAHSEGVRTTADGYASHAEGCQTNAVKDYSHTQNLGTIASMWSQTALGQYNVADTAPSSDIRTGFSRTKYGNYAVVIGNGTADDARSNALTVDWNGSVDMGGTLKVNGTTAYLLFKTTAISNFSPPTGISECMVLDTSDNGLYWYTS